MRNSLLLPYFFVVLLSTSCAQNTDNEINTPETLDFTAELVVGNVQNAWGMVFLPNNAILISEKSGRLLLNESGNTIEVENAPKIYNRGQGGLMDIELHPDYDKNGWIYFSFASEEGEGKGGNTAIMRAKLSGNKLVGNEVLYKATPNSTRGQHFGSRIEFDRDGYLFFSIGERGNRDVNPQDISRDGGKIYRLHDDGSIPSDNPFVNEPGAKKAIWSYGHRNPQGLTLHPTTGVLWEHEHGPRGGDEINIIQKGKNYGWPIITYGINYSGTEITDETSRPGMEQPLYQWTPSIAPSGMTFVTSDKYPKWKGNLLVGSLAFQYLERLELKDNKVVYREKLLDGMGRLRNVRQAPDGYIYISVEGKGLYRLVPK
ncbi:MAG: PQQ-dependent sugar dehydrogenase [Bacteroidota bacterium]|uniref:PQQ-dependent sugar dehydrogenase n=1 Tax=Flagellimonas profundi TaxID=2915620 RepID=A0ABS3FEJ3_9FLAO|nr:PQQ-dependent sugar dehydrogenase [Allomuricauda profundi]MBO0341559.1 PQQ-dependent sugar dehydrogenase [Allomuricauda profundi]MEC7771330.1 PQQ-dependent sugar dehydrogenase [Bacteroidota bacterium]